LHIKRVSISGFRGLETSVSLTQGLALIAGANNAGKSSVIDAIRCALLPFNERQGDRWIGNSDFSHLAAAATVHPPIEITLEISGIKPQDSGRLISVLSPASGAGTGRILLRSESTVNGRPRTRYMGGDFGQNEVESIAREAVRFVYLPALRDAEADLRPGLGNRLTTLLSSFAPDGHPDRIELVRIIEEANAALSKVEAVKQSADAVQSRLTDITGKGPFEQSAHMGFSEARYERIIGNLQAMLGGKNPVQLAENGLGYNNLLYIAVILAAIQSDETVPLTVLLIEEPEAHLHPQLQSRLLEYLESLTSEKTQVIVTTHSPQFASTAELSRVTVLSRSADGLPPEARHLNQISATPKEIAHLGRFLDVTKSALLFAEGVILVEGIAEQLLMPQLANRLGLSLSELGIQVVSVDGLAFAPFAKLFSPQALTCRCAIVSDSDPAIDEEGNEIPTSATADSLARFVSDQHQVRLAEKTFEWDLAHANYDNPELILKALKAVRPVIGEKVASTVFASSEEFADELLFRVKAYKGPFAQELASVLSENTKIAFSVPAYIEETLKWVIGDN
jgi:putative ATP-dependent endonuclease of OLD family